MPRPDPLPASPPALRTRLKRAIRLVALFAFVIAALAVLLVSRGQPGWQLHMMIATGAGIFLTVTLAGTLMLLIFFSSSSGHDEAAAHFDPENDRQ